MAFPSGYVELPERVAEAFSIYEAKTGIAPLLVGGAAAAILTAGAFMSGDFDIIAENDEVFADAVVQGGFVADERVGRLRGGFYHPDHPEYGVELVSGPPFNGRMDRSRLLRPVFRNNHSIALPSCEDLIADRLGQHAVASPSDDSRLRQARLLLTMAQSIDMHYLECRVAEEGGDFSLLDLDLRKP